MNGRLASVLLALALSSAPSFSALAGTKSSAPKTVAVHGYFKKDGTYIAPYCRAAPAPQTYATPASALGSYASTQFTPPPLVRSPVYIPRAGARIEPFSLFYVDGFRIKRSSSARHAFMVSTGFAGGRPGYVVDHIEPLACGGADDSSNMQWQTVADAKEKDRWERRGCH